MMMLLMMVMMMMMMMMMMMTRMMVMMIEPGRCLSELLGLLCAPEEQGTHQRGCEDLSASNAEEGIACGGTRAAPQRPLSTGSGAALARVQERHRRRGKQEGP